MILWRKRELLKVSAVSDSKWSASASLGNALEMQIVLVEWLKW
jgi:hypothetical protein